MREVQPALLQKLVPTLGILYTLLALLLLGAGRWHYLAVLPLLLAVGYALWHGVQMLWWVAVAAVPLSLEVELLPGWALTLPTDILALVLMGVLLLLLPRAQHLHIYWRHPISLLLLAFCVWSALCCITSTAPLRSVKQMLALLWMSAAFFWLGQQLVVGLLQRRLHQLGLLLPTLGIALYTLVQHSSTGFSFETSSEAMRPFYKDHGTYATALNFLLLLLLPWLASLQGLRKLGGMLIAIVLATAILFSYTRGAWLGLVAGLVLMGLLAVHYARPVLARSLAVVLLVGLVGLGTWVVSDGLKGDKDGTRGISHHILSSFYTQGNLSNQERVNRWVAAWDMLWQRPVLGWGPGAYTVYYAGHQQARYKTEISTNQGTLGGAHSEWLAAGTDAGLPGLLLWLSFFATTLWVAIRGALRASDAHLRCWWLGLAAAWLSYMLHACINNFMDQDKVAVPVWVMAACIVVLDTRHQRRRLDS